MHFSGIGGVGMSALAQIHAMDGGPATGSDRDFDRGRGAALKAKLEALGVKLFPQDGSAISKETGLVVLSTAIEDSNPEIAAAKALGVPLMHRSEFLARHVAGMRTIAVTGTSGKSTVVAMIFEILEAAGRGPSVITGGALIALQKKGLTGNAFRGESDILVVEADESDGSLVNYRPAVGVFLNLTKDHLEVSALREIGNICLCWYLVAVSKMIDSDLIPAPPDATVDLLGAVLDLPLAHVGVKVDTVIAVHTVFKSFQKEFDGYFLLLPEEQMLDVILEKMGDGR